MSTGAQVIELHSSPHLKSGASVESIMANVVYALLPVCTFSVYAFGISGLALIATAVLSCVLTEHLVCRLSGKESSISDYSVIITGMLLGLTLPPGFPLWMAALGGVVGVAMGKTLFGGLGFNAFNPALVGRAFLQASFPVAITTWSPGFTDDRFTSFVPSSLAWPFCSPPSIQEWTASLAVDGWSGATPLALQKFSQVTTEIWPLLTGMTAGSAGETPALLILVCGLYLIARNMMDWRVPAAVLLSAFITSGAFFLADSAKYPNPLFTILAGGLMLGAMFMASDMVASPVTPAGVWIYGALIGFLSVIIRLKGGLPEGVMYAILLGNACSPLIDNVTQPRIYGARKKKTS